MSLAKGATPDAKVVGEWDPNYWSHEPSRGSQHMAVVEDEWRTSCACSGCPECDRELTVEAEAIHWVWVPAKRWADAACPECDTLVCEQARLGLWRYGTSGVVFLCGGCLRAHLDEP